MKDIPWYLLIFLKRSLVIPILLFSSISLHWSLRKAFLSLLFFFGTLHSNGFIFPFFLCLSLLFFSQPFVKPSQTTNLPFYFCLENVYASVILLCVLSHVWHFMSPWNGTLQALVSMGFPRQEYWCGLPFPTPRNLPDPGDRTCISCLSCILGGFFITVPKGKPAYVITLLKFVSGSLLSIRQSLNDLASVSFTSFLPTIRPHAPCFSATVNHTVLSKC